MFTQRSHLTEIVSNVGIRREDVLIVTPRFLGLGEDRIIGGPCGPAFRAIDLSQLTHPVDIHWATPDSGSITDGVDSIVFQGVEEIILPGCMYDPPQDPIAAVA